MISEIIAFFESSPILSFMAGAIFGTITTGYFVYHLFGDNEQRVKERFKVTTTVE